MMHMCGKCSKIFGSLVLIAGILFLLQDIGTWAFFNLNWYTVIFLIIGVSYWGSGNCKNCMALAKKR